MRYREEHRQLAAIMFTDIVGFTTLMSESEASALRVLKRSRRLVRRLTRRFKGRWLETVGDGNLISFASATDAVNCALTIQQHLHKDSDLKLRIGIHVGDVIDAGGHIYGDGVNVASRIHELAEPGGIVVSEPVYDAVRNKSGINTERMGVRDLEGLDHPIQVYSLAGEAVDEPLLGFIDQPGRRRWVFAFTAALAVAAMLSAGIYSRYGDVHAGTESIAVLPFEDLSPDSTNRYFSEGISEELINKLSRVPGLRVAGRSSSFAVGDQELDVRKIGKDLNVSHVLDGSVRKSGNRVRINAQLVNTDNGFQVWTDTYEAEMDDIFRVQQDISQAIVEALRLELLPREFADVGRISTRDVKAYDLYLKARTEMREADTAEEYDSAISLLEDALRRDPMFVEAEAAKCEALVDKYKQTRANQIMESAVEICNRAMTMDPESPLAHIALGNLYLTTGRYNFAVETFGKALPLDPENTDLYLSLAEAFVRLGRFDHAHAYYREAMKLSPADSRVYQNRAWAFLMEGKEEEAIAPLKKAIELKPDQSSYYSDLSVILFNLGKVDQAVEVLSDAIERKPYGYDRAYNNLATYLFFAGEYERSVEAFRKTVEMNPDDPRFTWGLADACRLAEGCSEWRDLYRKTIDLADARLRINPDDAHVMSIKAICQVFLGKSEQARRMAQQAVDRGPEDGGVMNNVAVVYSQLGEVEKAEKYLEEARAKGYSETKINNHPDIRVEEAKMARKE
jgi:TolB-like protein/Flp pilus assembly protein TadD/class 3 adenylate cyclase